MGSLFLAALRRMLGLSDNPERCEQDAGYIYAKKALRDGTESVASLDIFTRGSPDSFDQGVQLAIRDMTRSGEIPDPRQPINKGI